MRINHNSLDKFFDERSTLDKRFKDMMFNTLIPPPVSKEADANIRSIYITELEKDLSYEFISPSTVQDPCWVDYDEAVVRVKLVEKMRRRRRNCDDVWREGPRLVDQLNVQCGMLQCLQEYMKNFGTDVQPELSSLKVMLDHHYGGDKEFVANFMLSTIMAMLRAVMFQLSKLR